jgi:hypothetical protein
MQDPKTQKENEMKTASKKATSAKKATAVKKVESTLDDKKVVALFKGGASTGEICLKLGMPRTSATRKLVREVLRSAGTYERRMPSPSKKEVPDAK